MSEKEPLEKQIRKVLREKEEEEARLKTMLKYYKPMGSGNPNEEECRRAFQASLELIEEKCGVSFEGGKAITLREVGLTVRVPEKVEKVASSNPELTREERIEAVSETDWAHGWGKGMCSLVAPELTGREREECIGRMARTLAERVV